MNLMIYKRKIEAKVKIGFKDKNEEFSESTNIICLYSINQFNRF
jgi:hypothetical protein